MARNQNGITLMSFVIVLVVVGFFALVVMKLFPIYSEHHNLKAVMKEFSAQPNASTLTQPQVMLELERRFNIAYVESVKKEHVKIVREGTLAKLNIAYEVRRPLFGNLDVVAKFDDTVTLNNKSTSE